MPVNETDTLPIPLLLPAATHHHLDSLVAEIHRSYFSRYPPLTVRWGQQIARKRRRSIRLGSYNHITGEIRIHPILNAPHVPAFFIQSVIHHEYLHHVLGAHHNRRFHERERRFRYHREAQEWIRLHLLQLLGRRARRIHVPPAPPSAVQAALF